MPAVTGEARLLNKEAHDRLALAKEREQRVHSQTDQLAEAFRRAMGVTGTR